MFFILRRAGLLQSMTRAWTASRRPSRWISDVWSRSFRSSSWSLRSLSGSGTFSIFERRFGGKTPLGPPVAVVRFLSVDVVGFPSSATRVCTVNNNGKAAWFSRSPRGTHSRSAQALVSGERHRREACTHRRRGSRLSHASSTATFIGAFVVAGASLPSECRRWCPAATGGRDTPLPPKPERRAAGFTLRFFFRVYVGSKKPPTHT